MAESGRWLSWQSTDRNGKRGKWTTNHYSEDGLRTLCGIKIPAEARGETTLGPRSCPVCWTRLNRRRGTE